MEVFSADSDAPASSVTTDIAFNCFDWVSPTEIVAADVRGQLTFIKGALTEDTTTITLINTKIQRYRDI